MIFTLYLLSFFAQALTPEVIQHAQAGSAALEQGKLEVAISEFKQVIALQPENVSGHLNLGNAYFKGGDYEKAVPELQQALKLQPTLLGADQALGVALLMQGNAAASIPYLEKAPDPQLLGLAYLESGRLSDAIIAWQKALVDHPDDPNVLYFFTRTTALASKQAYARLQAVGSGSARAHEAMADRAVDMGRIQEALREYQEAIKINPNAPGVHLAAGKALATASNWPAAVSEFELETKLRPASAEAWYYLGSALLAQKDHAKEALEALEHSNRLQGDMPGTLFAAGKAASQAGDAAATVQYLTKMLELGKADDLAPQAHFLLGDAYRKLGKIEDADRESALFKKTNNGGKP